MMTKCLSNPICNLSGTDSCNRYCPKYKELTYLLSKSCIPEKRQAFQRFNVPQIDKKLFDSMKKVIENITDYIDNGQSFVLYSENTGNGKTSWAIQFMLYYFDNIWAGNGFRPRGYFLYVPDFINRVKANIRVHDGDLQDIMDTIKDVDLLILDDIGTTNMSEYDISVLSSIIDQRCLGEKSTIYTTNCNRYKLAEIVGERLADRIWGNSTVFHFNGKSNRGI